MQNSNYFRYIKNKLVYPILRHGDYSWRDILAISALLFFSIAFWIKELSFHAYNFAHYLLILAWILDGGLSRLKETIKEPFVAAMLILCIVMALGIFWSDDLKLGFKVFRRYTAFLIFIPYLSLLNKERLLWAIGGILIGYFSVLAMGIYQWIILDLQGIPPLSMPYLKFSSMLGIGVLLALYLASITKDNKTKIFLSIFSIFLLFIQFNQDARGILIATIVSSVLLIFLFFRKEIGKFLSIMTLLVVVCGIFAYNSDNFQRRLSLANNNIKSFKAGDYNTSPGQRLALWDIGLHGIAERPLFGHGTGMALHSFDTSVQIYKSGFYKNLPKFVHYHNDWVEIGTHIGALGLFAYAYLLWGWFQTLKAHKLAIPGAALLCFVFLCGITDLFVFFRQTIFLLVAITAIGICWQRTQESDSIPITMKEKIMSA